MSDTYYPRHASKPISPREALTEACPMCDGGEHGCGACNYTGRIIRTTHEPGSDNGPLSTADLDQRDRGRGGNAEHSPFPSDKTEAKLRAERDRYRVALEQIATPERDPKYPLCCNQCDGSSRTRSLPINHEDGCPVGIARAALLGDSTKGGEP